MRRDGFTLVWVLMLLTLLGSLAAALMQSAGTSARSARSVASGSLIDIAERNVLSYNERLLEANAASLLRTLPVPDGGNAAQVAARLQAEVAGWCGRDPDGRGRGRVRVYFTDRACGLGLPEGVAAPQPRLVSQGAGLWRLEAPFVLVASTSGRPAVRTGALHASYGAAPASVYGLLAPGSLTLDPAVRVQGDVHADGPLTLRGAVGVDGVLSSSGCTVVTPGCVGTRVVGLGDAVTPVMRVTPSPGHPPGLSGFLALGQSGETGGMVAPTLPGLTVTAQELVLGVTGGGEQVVRTCLYGACTEYVGGLDGGLRDASGTVVIAAWTGAIGVTGVGGGSVSLRPVNADAPSVARPVSVVSVSPVVLDGSLTYAQSTCAGSVCNAAGVSEVLSVQAPALQVSAGTVRVHGTLIAPTVRLGGALTLYGTVLGVPQGGSLFVQADPRARRGVAAPGVPRLPAQWRGARVEVKP